MLQHTRNKDGHPACEPHTHAHRSSLYLLLINNQFVPFGAHTDRRPVATLAHRNARPAAQLADREASFHHRHTHSLPAWEYSFQTADFQRSTPAKCVYSVHHAPLLPPLYQRQNGLSPTFGILLTSYTYAGDSCGHVWINKFAGFSKILILSLSLPPPPTASYNRWGKGV